MAQTNPNEESTRQKNMMQYVLERVSEFTGNDISAINGKSRIWSLMYARYLFFDIVVRLGIKPEPAVEFIARNRTMIYPYKVVVGNMKEVDSKFISDSEFLFESVKKHFFDGWN